MNKLCRAHSTPFTIRSHIVQVGAKRPSAVINGHITLSFRGCELTQYGFAKKKVVASPLTIPDRSSDTVEEGANGTKGFDRSLVVTRESRTSW